MTTITKRCPKCGRALVVRTNGATGEEFLGCVGYGTGACDHTEKIPESLRMRLAGAPTLPFMDEENDEQG